MTLNAPLYVLGTLPNSLCTLLVDPRQQLALLNPNCFGLLSADFEPTYSTVLRELVLLVCMQRELPAVSSGVPSPPVTLSRLLAIRPLTPRLRLTNLTQKPLCLKTLRNLFVVCNVLLNRLSSSCARTTFDGYLEDVTTFPEHPVRTLPLTWGHCTICFLRPVLADVPTRPIRFLLALVYTARRATRLLLDMLPGPCS